jgi:hypothetical protein
VVDYFESFLNPFGNQTETPKNPYIEKNGLPGIAVSPAGETIFYVVLVKSLSPWKFCETFAKNACRGGRGGTDIIIF